MNNLEKGRWGESKIKEWLEEDGYIVWKPVRVKFHSCDIFGLFDLVAVNQKGRFIFIQVKSNKNHVNEAKRRIEEFAKKVNYSQLEDIIFAVVLHQKNSIKKFNLSREFEWKEVV
jgi:Holliday junction resolvase-like predicted endonuclease